MPTEFDDSQHYGVFTTNPTLTSNTGMMVRQSELTLAALRAAGVFENMIDGTVAPTTDKLWLDKNFDPAILKEWDATGSAWMPMTFDRLFGRAVVTPLGAPSGTADALVVAQPSIFMNNRLFSLTPVLENTGPATIQVSGVGTYPVRYADGAEIDAKEFAAGKPTILLFTGSVFVVLFATAHVHFSEEAAQAALDAIAAAVSAAQTAIGDTTTAAQTDITTAKNAAIDEITDLLPETIKTVTSLAEFKALDTNVHQTVYLDLYGEVRLFKWRLGSYSAAGGDEWGAVFVKADAIAVTTGVWVAQYGWAMLGVPARYFGFLSGSGNVQQASMTVAGVPKTVSKGPFQRAADFCTDLGLIFVIDQKYWIDHYFMCRSGMQIAFRGEGELVANTAEPVIGGFFTGRYGPTVSDITSIDNLKVWNLRIDCNQKGSMNGIALPYLTNAHFYGSTIIKNTLHDVTYLGGRAVQIEGGLCWNIHFEDVYIDNCSIGINSQALPSPSDYEAKHFTYGKVVMREVGMPFNVDATSTGAQNIDVRRMSTYVAEAILWNCGRPSWLAGADRYKGGIITGDRGSGLMIDSLRVVNEASYGLVGGLFKGTMYGVVVNKAELTGQFNRIADFNYLDYITSASSLAQTSWVEADVILRTGTADRIIDVGSGGNRMGPVRLEVTAYPSSILNGICSTNAGAYSIGKVKVNDANTGTPGVWRTLLQTFNWGNTFEFMRGRVKSSRHRKDCGSSVAKAFFLVPLAPHARVSGTIDVSAFGPGGSVNAAARFDQYPVSIQRNGNGTIASAIGTPISAVALTGYTSMTTALTITSADANTALIEITQANNFAAECAVMATAELAFAIAGASIVFGEDQPY